MAAGLTFSKLMTQHASNDKNNKYNCQSPHFQHFLVWVITSVNPLTDGSLENS
jgi:hypothetical protein